MKRESHQELLTILKPNIERYARRAEHGSGEFVQPDIRLAILLRILAGASCIDLLLVVHIGRSTVFTVFHSTLCAIISTLKMPGVPIDDALKMRELSDAFGNRTLRPNLCGAVLKPWMVQHCLCRSHWTNIKYYILSENILCSAICNS
jgi:hypothetical protein